MENLTNQILDLENGKQFFVLRHAVYKGVTYSLGAEVTSDGEDFTNEFAFLEKVDGDELLIKKVTDPKIIEVLAKNIKIE